MSLNINQDRDTKGQFAGGILLGDNAVMVRRDLAMLPDFISKLGILCRGPFREVLTGRFHTGLANGKVELCLFSGDLSYPGEVEMPAPTRGLKPDTGPDGLSLIHI